MQITSEDFQRYLRIVLQWAASALVSYGMIKPDATWVAPTTGFILGLGSLFWTLYGNRVQAKINEVAKLDVVDHIKVNDPVVAHEAPVNVSTLPATTPVTRPL